MVGYILRVHPAWAKFVSVAKSLGKPLVMRMNLNQQSSGDQWYTHKQLMNSMSPIVDCGVHYVDIMCLMTESTPVTHINPFAGGKRKVGSVGVPVTDTESRVYWDLENVRAGTYAVTLMYNCPPDSVS